MTGDQKDVALREMYADISAKNLFPFWAKKSDVEQDDIRQLMSGPKPVPSMVGEMKNWIRNFVFGVLFRLPRTSVLSPSSWAPVDGAR